MKQRKVIAMFLTLAMTAALLAVPAVSVSAVSASSVTVAGIELSATKPYLIKDAADQWAASDEEDGSYAAFTPDTGTLTFTKSAALDGPVVSNRGTALKADGDLKLVINSGVALTLRGEEAGAGSHAIYVTNGDVMVSGGGSLTAGGGKRFWEGDKTAVIWAPDGSVTLDGITANICTYNETNNTLTSYYAVWAKEGIHILNDATVTIASAGQAVYTAPALYADAVAQMSTTVNTAWAGSTPGELVDYDAEQIANIKYLSVKPFSKPLKAIFTEITTNQIKVDFTVSDVPEPVKSIAAQDVTVTGGAEVESVVMDEDYCGATITLANTSAAGQYEISFEVSVQEGFGIGAFRYVYRASKDTALVMQEDFESYTVADTWQASGFAKAANRAPESYSAEEFRVHSWIDNDTDQELSTVTYDNLKNRDQDGKIIKGSPDKVLAVVNQLNGKALAFRRELFVKNIGMSRGIDLSSAEGKTLKYDTRFTIPATEQCEGFSMRDGEFFGMYFSKADNNVVTPGYIELNTSTYNTSHTDKQLMLVRKSSRDNADNQLIISAFNEIVKDQDGEILELSPNTVYDYSVILEPVSDGAGYTATILVVSETSCCRYTLPSAVLTETTPEELRFLTLTGKANWSVANSLAAQSEPDYSMYYDKPLIYVDDLALYTTEAIKPVAVEGLNDKGEIMVSAPMLNIAFSAEIGSVDVSKITVDGGAAVASAAIDAGNEKMLHLTLENLELAKHYTISLAGIYNKAGMEYTGTLDAYTSDGIDVEEIKLNGEASGTAQAGTNVITVNISKAAGVGEKIVNAAVIAVAYEPVGDSWRLRSLDSKEVRDLQDNETLDLQLEAQLGDRIKVFIWNDFTVMTPIKEAVVF